MLVFGSCELLDTRLLCFGRDKKDGTSGLIWACLDVPANKKLKLGLIQPGEIQYLYHRTWHG
jgi:hypothetical protein